MFNGLMVAVSELIISGSVTDRVIISLILIITIISLRLVFRVFKGWINIAILEIVVLLIAIATLIFYTQYKPKIEDSASLKIIKFTPLKQEYSVDENIAFEIEANSDSYYYLHTQTEGTSKMKLLKLDSSNHLQKNKSKKVGYFRVKNYVGDEQALLTVCDTPYKEFQKDIEESVYIKELEYVGGLADESADIKETRCTQREINIKVKAPQAKVTITAESSNYRVAEDIDLEVSSTADGSVAVFEATPQISINKLYSSPIAKSKPLRSTIEAREPLGHHIAIAIYSRFDNDMGIDDFTIVQLESIKGQPRYKLKFKDGKKHTYDMQYFTISE